MENYLHGYESKEQERLYHQARFLEPVVYSTVDLSGVRSLLEIGCGVGAQSEVILRRYPGLRLTGVDVSSVQIDQAERHFDRLPELRPRCEFHNMDAAHLDFPPAEKFDAAFICWLLEHVSNPVHILREARRMLRPGGKIILTEVLNHSLYISPPAPVLQHYWEQFNQVQLAMKGDPYVGAKLGTLLDHAGFTAIKVTPRPFYYDRRVPGQRAAMFAYWTELMLSGAESLIAAGRVSADTVAQLREEMAAISADADGIFYYTFVQAEAIAPDETAC